MFISVAYQLLTSATRSYYHVLFCLSTTFFNFFQDFFQSFFETILNGERGIWTLAPLLTTYSLSRGAPSASWVLLHMFNCLHKKTTKHCWWFQAQRVGFEPTCPFGQTVFKTASLWPLRYLCKYEIYFTRVSDVIHNSMAKPYCQHLFSSLFAKNFCDF